jgi:hypothetical protein
VAAAFCEIEVVVFALELAREAHVARVLLELGGITGGRDVGDALFTWQIRL